MSRGTVPLTERLHAYLLTNSLREHPVLERLRRETAQLPEADMQIAPVQGQLMALLVELIDARRVLEIGCFTGYSALAMALALPPGGRLITLDVNRDWAEIARRAWREAGVAAKIELRLGLAVDTLAGLLAEGMAGEFDLAFVDADKKSYDVYYEHALRLVRPGGLILLDNMLWGGAVADPNNADRQTQSLRALTAKLQRDQRIGFALLPIADGLALARRRAEPVQVDSRGHS